jgi:single-strand DNA-binding protein
MAGLNKVFLIGYLGRSPEIRQTTEALSITNFPLATSGKWGDKVKTEWHKIICFGKLADIAEKYLTKGSLIYVEGRIQTRQYEKDDQTRYITEIVASNFQFLDSKRQGGDKSAQTQQGQNNTSALNDLPNGNYSDDDIPF